MYADYEINKHCSCKKFRFANKYVSHKHPGDLNNKQVAKERFNEIRDDVKAALDRASDSRKRRKDLPSRGLQKKRKPTVPNNTLMDFQENPHSLPEAAQSVSGGAASLNVPPFQLANPGHAGSLNGAARGLSFFQGAGDMVAPATIPFSLYSGPQYGIGNFSESTQSCSVAMGPIHNTSFPNQQALPSEPPNLWKMATWITDTDWNSGDPQF
jgi:hypothetical protein